MIHKPARPTTLDAAVSRAIAERRATPGYAQDVARLHKLVARTLCAIKPPATLPLEDINLVIGPSQPNPESDRAVRRAIAKSRLVSASCKAAVPRPKVA